MNSFCKLCAFLALFAQLSLAALNDFDILVFVQQFPKTTCINSRVPPARCNIPRNDLWTIHGIWPTKSGTNGPNSCRRDLPFKPAELRTIRRQLEAKWIDVIRTNPETFWRHEWERHGTCSVDLVDLNTQLKYFSKALQWNNRYNIESYLRRARITPGRAYPSADIVRAINRGVGLQTRITCITQV
ncbi:ribonuclease T2-like [Leptopilina boulardi]|uniref:ribonuclease T2-like n=1 Tax=Leptopilina boulardi TaxID=63433 RepID=UPI0021F58412|nr:ribonuclease T2-like [Leptopilina boulardi]